MLVARHTLPLRGHWQSQLLLRSVNVRYQSGSAKHAVDSCGIPLRPTWSVHHLLSSYPTPRISPTALKRLYELSALIPPEECTPDHKNVTTKMREMVGLVEAVRLINTDGVKTMSHSSQIEGRGKTDTQSLSSCNSAELLQHASLTTDGFYVVEADRRR